MITNRIQWFSFSATQKNFMDRESSIKCIQVANLVYDLLRSADGDISSLPEPVRVFMTVNGAQGVIDNGGYKYFFGADWPDNPPYEVFASAYETIGCISQAQDFRRVIATFPFINPHIEKEQRDKYIEENYDSEEFEIRGWGDKLCGDKDVWKKLAAYYDRHSEAFAATEAAPLPVLRFPTRHAKDADHFAIVAIVGGFYLWSERVGLPVATFPWICGIAITSAVSGVLLWLRIPHVKWLGVLNFVALGTLGVRRIILDGWNHYSALTVVIALVCAFLVGRIDYSQRFIDDDDS